MEPGTEDGNGPRYFAAFFGLAPAFRFACWRAFFGSGLTRSAWLIMRSNSSTLIRISSAGFGFAAFNDTIFSGLYAVLLVMFYWVNRFLWKLYAAWKSGKLRKLQAFETMKRASGEGGRVDPRAANEINFVMMQIGVAEPSGLGC